MTNIAIKSQMYASDFRILIFIACVPLKMNYIEQYRTI